MEAIFVVYRRKVVTRDTYIPVIGSIKEINIPWGIIRKSKFECKEEVLSPDEQFNIQENDIVAACIKDISPNYPLILLGTSHEADLKTYELDSINDEDCTLSQINRVDTSYFQFRHRSSLTLHLFANIGMFHCFILLTCKFHFEYQNHFILADIAATCRAGNNPSPADAVNTSSHGGTYLNTQYPVTCGNHITKWHYCYHTEAATPGSTLSMTVAVWSLDTAINTYIVSPSSIRTITLQPITTLAKIFCVEHNLGETEYSMVSPGDVIGIVLPSTNAIPIVSTSAGSEKYIVKHAQNEHPLNVVQSKLQAVYETTLHLYATVGK